VALSGPSRCSWCSLRTDRHRPRHERRPWLKPPYQREAKNQRRRHNFHHQVSAALIDPFGLIATEKLQMANTTRSTKGTVDRPGKNVKQRAGLNREMLDMAPARFLKFRSYKACDISGSADEIAQAFADLSRLRDGSKESLDERWHDCMTNLAMLRRLIPV
jgi:putative transposase